MGAQGTCPPTRVGRRGLAGARRGRPVKCASAISAIAAFDSSVGLGVKEELSRRRGASPAVDILFVLPGSSPRSGSRAWSAWAGGSDRVAARYAPTGAVLCGPLRPSALSAFNFNALSHRAVSASAD